MQKLKDVKTLPAADRRRLAEVADALSDRDLILDVYGLDDFGRLVGEVRDGEGYACQSLAYLAAFVRGETDATAAKVAAVFAEERDFRYGV